MKKSIVVILLTCINVASSHAQKMPVKNTSRFADFTLGIGSRQGSAALAYINNWQLGKRKKIEAGIGLRFTSYFAGSQYYTTAPAILTTGKTGPGVFFGSDIPANIDSIQLKKSQVNALNISINLGYNISPKWYAGFNIDAIGLSFGGSKPATYFPNASTGTAVTAKPTSFNLLLVSDNDRGSLNSEFFARYAFNERWGAKLAYEFLFAEYTTSTEVQTTPSGKKNDRFRNKVSALGIGISYHF